MQCHRSFRITEQGIIVTKIILIIVSYTAAICLKDPLDVHRDQNGSVERIKYDSRGSYLHNRTSSSVSFGSSDKKKKEKEGVRKRNVFAYVNNFVVRGLDFFLFVNVPFDTFGYVRSTVDSSR